MELMSLGLVCSKVYPFPCQLSALNKLPSTDGIWFSSTPFGNGRKRGPFRTSRRVFDIPDFAVQFSIGCHNNPHQTGQTVRIGGRDLKWSSYPPVFNLLGLLIGSNTTTTTTSNPMRIAKHFLCGTHTHPNTSMATQNPHG